MPDFLRTAPSDDEVLACVAPPGSGLGDATYVVKNRLSMARPYGYGHKIETPAVLRRLKRLEREGRVERAKTSYAVMIAWRRTSEPAHA